MINLEATGRANPEGGIDLRLVDGILLLAGEGFHFFCLGFAPGNAFKFEEVKTCI